ncbi:hypothetical protein Poli38472_000620 [Pythium oligandrum]|uniref:Uncharacterized protein n=1 Tax=Pythium oligandrum TaxID=41045 RepID=A0A8K1CDF9_PYTOL|nr:hypothetical protein Poli38472_000620 [Pythium oligandrum]|eukprot:TMW60578.1 hypothetical protein Poli38472_000620 [Pythium oligandrum]
METTQAPSPRNDPSLIPGNDQELADDSVVPEDESSVGSTLFYSDFKTPYLTCSRCNSVTFIDVRRVRPKDAPRDPDALSLYEQVPICAGCGTTKYLRAGVVSFQEKIAEEQQAIKEFERKRGPATELIQRIARGFMGRLEYRRRKLAWERYIRKINQSATMVQTRVRGMQARRRTILERCLRIIRTLHPSILKFALTARPDCPPVFWYDNPSELQILFWNYREFVRRSGGKPPLVKVETNILEITRRMLLREYELVSRIQSRWRGLTTRLVFFEFKRQRGWLRGLQQSPAIKIQRLFRAHCAKRRCKALREVRNYPQHRAKYVQERVKQAEDEKAKTFRARLLAKYRLSYQVNKTSKMMALEAKPESTSVHTQSNDVTHSLRKTPRVVAKTSDKAQFFQLTVGNNHEVDSSPVKSLDKMHPNARKLAQVKRQLEAKRKRLTQVRGPRLHILHAQAYATSIETNGNDDSHDESDRL